MASARNISNVGSYCDVVFGELTDMKTRLLNLVGEIERMMGHDKDLVKSHIKHLRYIADTIDWKLEILARACPTDWAKYSADVGELSLVSSEKFNNDEFVSPGDIGG